jgi:hypothetical protein
LKTFEEIMDIFKSEFAFLVDRFTIVEIPVSRLHDSARAEENLPGVYIHWSPSRGVIKVGKSQKNSRTRCIEHLRYSTHNKDGTYSMGQLSDEDGAKVFFFNVKEKDIHWVLSLEYYLEKRLEPYIRSDRNG